MSAAVATARPSQALRLRREFQRPSLTRSSTAKANNMENGVAKEEVKRYVYTQQDILAKFKGSPPSLRVQLHASHFRLNDSQESLSYASPMREILQHIRDKTVPHNMLDEFYLNGIPFYDNCLIVEVHDHRSGGVKPKDESATTADGIKTEPFSIHNYNNFITPSPHVPYPSKTPTKSSQADGKARVTELKEDKDLDKENMPAPGQPASQKQPTKVKITTVVLFPTQQSHFTDIQLMATTPAPDMQTYRRNQAAGRAAGNPPTPLTSVPPTPTLPQGRSPKRQKMVIDQDNIHEFESEMLNAICPKLYLEPTKNLGQSVALIEAMSHPNNQNSAPLRKSRKRTTAELAADEAEAADMQRFMLAADEWQLIKTGSAVGGDEAQAGGRGANVQTFARFKTLASIKMKHEEAERRKKEDESRIAQAKKQAQVELEAQKRREMEANRQAEQTAAMMHHRQEQHARQQQQQLQLQHDNALRASHAQQMVNASQGQSQTPLSATQPQFSSPVIRQGTPMAANSPLVNGHVSHPMGGTPMVTTSSNHGAGSPARPPSAVSHHPQGMARTISQQQNQSMSRTGTPQMLQGTPVMNSAMPSRAMASTPQPRVNQSSPTPGLQGGTPIMMGTPQSGQQGMTQEQMQQMAQAQQLQMQQRARAQAMHQSGMQASPGQNTTPQQMAMHKAKLHIQREGIPQGQNPQLYQQMVASQFYKQMQTQQQQQQQQQHQQQQQQQQQQQMSNMSPQNLGHGMPHAGVPTQGALNIGNMSLQQLQQQYMNRKQQLITTYGSTQAIPQQHMQLMRQLELAMQRRDQQTQAAQAVQVAQAQAQAQGGQMHMNPAMQNQMSMQGGNTQNSAQAQQQYQQLLQQQRTNQARQQQMLAMRQHGMAGGQIPQGMMNNMQMMNAGGNMSGMNMNMQNMQTMAGMQGMQGQVPMNQMNPQQQQQMQMMLMRQAQAQAQMRAGQQRPGQGDGSGMEWSGV